MKDQKSTFRKLKEICSINPPLGVKVEPDTLVSFLPMEDVAENGGRIGYQARQRSQIALGLTAFRNDDILIAKITPCFENEKGWLANGLEAGVGFGSTELHVIRCGKEILPRFVYAHTLLPQFRLRGKRYMTGSAGQQRVPASFLNDYVIWVPDLQLQSAICRVDVAYERSLLTFDRLIAAKREQKRGLMQQLLTGKLRFPGFTEPWKTVRLGDVADIDSELLPASTSPTFAFHYIDLSSVNYGDISAPDKSIDFATAPSRARRVLRRGDVLLSTVRPLLLGFGLLDLAGGPYIGSTGFAVIRTEAKGDARFIFEWLFSSAALRQMHARTTGSSYPALGSADIHGLYLPWPPSSEREKIGALFGAMTKELNLLEQQRAAFAAQRRGLMEKLLSGEIDIQNSKETAA